MSGTGWHWDHVMNHCDVPMYLSMCRFWRDVPPAAVQLRRIASYIGLKPETRSANAVQTSAPPAHATLSTTEEVAAAAAMAGLPVFPGRPNDPMLDLIHGPAPQTLAA